VRTPPTISVVRRPGLAYPPAGEDFSPHEAYPEYPWPGRLAAAPNPVYAAVREVFAQSGLDAQAFGRPDWNPLGRWIAPGARVFLLCNFVYHRKPHEGAEAFSSKCTHASVLRALADYVLIAAGPEGKVEFGNAPVQSAEWSRLMDETGAGEVAAFYESVGAPVEPRDLRLYVAPRNAAGGIVQVEARGGEAAVEVDLGADSLLATLGGGETARFRVSDYDPRRTDSYHTGGSHVYAINRRVLEADVVFSLPKLKTHEKVGLTCALKGFVGAIALKDCLAHHRSGGPAEGGDEYPRGWLPLRAATAFHEWVQRRESGSRGLAALQVVDRTLRRLAVRGGVVIGGAWHGNDTAWRMALDIARILRFSTADGRLQAQTQRTHLALIDGVVGGEGEGPLAPSPVESGVLVFSDDPALADLVASELVGFAPEALPIVHQAFARRRYPVSDAAPETATIVVNGQPGSYATLRAGAVPFRAPRGWRGRLEVPAHRT
jgi:uncharacterized protein (DUF362 family)